MKNKILRLSALFVILTMSQNVIAQIVTTRIIEEYVYPVIDCSGMPKNSVKTAAETVASLTLSNVDVDGATRVRRHRQHSLTGDYITGTYGTTDLYVNQKVSRKFLVAWSNTFSNRVDQEQDMTWADASGWELPANSEITGDTPTRNAQGCYQYGGRGEYLRGEWRLPTQRELLIMYSLQDQLESIVDRYGNSMYEFGDYTYWSATEFDAKYIYPVRFTDGAMVKSKKTSLFRARCVKDL